MAFVPHHAALLGLTRPDPDPPVRHRADGLLLVAGALSLTEAPCIGCSRHRLRSGG